ncbi:potassium/proton antiporter, CPA1 family [Thiohalospira halophila DSM 15071]|uniref:Potassium/proton antiporter, CPA1 family n=1 Tax=Thiohalospira halophila DSM 15071 TaxID=1123397 RepID=A0A1I1TG38_9GAMM|nr:potassium/proton antiporter [Thiohalospira halophila]SFD54520.1 potassium/proton antiporter, CPA1 family [Thiohalospira halophila DSM 15071]
MDFTQQLLLLGSALVLLSIVASPLSHRLGLPILAVFLALGMVAGSDGLGIEYHDPLSAFLIGNLALAIILFDGGLRTDTATFRVGLRPALSLATVGVVITAGITGAAAAWILELDPVSGLLLGAIVGSTDAAAVFGLLGARGLTLKQRVGATLEIESGLNDPMAVFLTLLFLEWARTGSDPGGLGVALQLVWQMGAGAALGLGGGWLLARLINALDLTEGLYPLAALAGGIGLFASANSLGGSGFLAVYLAGLVVGDRPLQAGHHIRRFNDGLAWLAQIGMFLILGLLVNPSEIWAVAPQGLAVAAVLMLLARPVAVFLGLAPFGLDWREQLFLSWVGLRGAVPIVLALFPLLAGLPDASTYFNIAFFVVLVSLLVQGATIAPVARRLGLDMPPQPQVMQRFELDIPAQYDYEFIGYRLEPDSPAAGRDPQAIGLPDHARVVAALREGRPLEPDDDCLCPGDYIYVLATPPDLPLLDRLFGPARPEEAAFFGEFLLNGDARLLDVAAIYGLEITVDDPGETLHDRLSHYFKGRQVVGDSLAIAGVRLTIREMEGPTITRVGLKF